MSSQPLSGLLAGGDWRRCRFRYFSGCFTAHECFFTVAHADRVPVDEPVAQRLLILVSGPFVFAPKFAGSMFKFIFSALCPSKSRLAHKHIVKANATKPTKLSADYYTNYLRFGKLPFRVFDTRECFCSVASRFAFRIYGLRSLGCQKNLAKHSIACQYQFRRIDSTIMNSKGNHCGRTAVFQGKNSGSTAVLSVTASPSSQGSISQRRHLAEISHPPEPR